MRRLYLQHKGGTNPALKVRATAEGYPAKTTGALGTDGSSNTASWGHIKPEASPTAQGSCHAIAIGPGATSAV